jgi:hypothetical protein
MEDTAAAAAVQQQQQFFYGYESTCPKKCRQPRLPRERTQVRCHQGRVNALMATAAMAAVAGGEE